MTPYLWFSLMWKARIDLSLHNDENSPYATQKIFNKQYRSIALSL